MIKSLVTGGAGFIGAHITKHLLAQGHSVTVLDDLSGGKRSNIPQGATFHKGSITNKELMDELFEQQRFDYVFHLAAYAAEGLSHFIRHFNYTNNLLGSINLINASVNNKVKCVVFTSSIAVYGTNELPLCESTVPQPEDPYGIAKLAVEMDLKAAHEMFGLNYIIFRPHNVYGEYQNLEDPYRNVIGIFMNQLLQGKPMTVFGSGEQSRAFSYIDDLAPHIAGSVNNTLAYNQTFNIGSNKHYSVKELAQAVARVMGREDIPIQYLDTRNEVLHAYADHSKFKTIFNVDERASTSLTKGLERMANWAKDQQLMSPSTFGHLEIEKNLPPSWK